MASEVLDFKIRGQVANLDFEFSKIFAATRPSKDFKMRGSGGSAHPRADLYFAFKMEIECNRKLLQENYHRAPRRAPIRGGSLQSPVLNSRVPLELRISGGEMSFGNPVGRGGMP